jgi:hypothetical protein
MAMGENGPMSDLVLGYLVQDGVFLALGGKSNG